MNRILILEDDKTLADLLGKAFIRKDFEVLHYCSVSEAEEIDEQTHLNYALLDLNLAGESSLKLITLLRERFPKIEIVMLTGYASISTAVEAIKLGAKHYLAKPASFKDIWAAFNDELVSKESDKKTNLKNLEWENIQKTLEKNDFNISKTAEELNMHRRTLQRKLQKTNYNK